MEINTRYRHFKGNEYIVLGIAKHSETLEEYVVYVPANDPTQMWVRAKEMFLEQVQVGERMVARFELLGKAEV